MGGTSHSLPASLLLHKDTIRDVMNHACPFTSITGIISSNKYMIMWPLGISYKTA